MHKRRVCARSLRTSAAAISLLIAYSISGGQGIAAPAPSDAMTAQVSKLVTDAESAEKTGNLNLALIQLKNAVQLAPTNGDIRARLGALLMRIGQAAAAERELRQA